MILTFWITLILWIASCALSMKILVGHKLQSKIFIKSPVINSKLWSVLDTSVDTKMQDLERAIFITENAMSQLQSLKSKMPNANFLRMGVKAGGCSGMSYTMDFVDKETIIEEDYIEEYGDIKCVIDPKSILYLYGLHLDYSNELIGGGFKFSNPNAESACGCGKSFGV